MLQQRLVKARMMMQDSPSEDTTIYHLKTVWLFCTSTHSRRSTVPCWVQLSHFVVGLQGLLFMVVFILTYVIIFGTAPLTSCKYRLPEPSFFFSRGVKTNGETILLL